MADILNVVLCNFRFVYGQEPIKWKFTPPPPPTPLWADGISVIFSLGVKYRKRGKRKGDSVKKRKEIGK
jgi:hypothetical protein